MSKTPHTHNHRGPGGPGPGHGYQKPKNAKKTFLRLFSYLAAQKGILLLVFFCMFLSSSCSVAASYLLKPIINRYIGAGFAVSPGFLQALCFLALLYLVSALATYGQSAIMAKLAIRGCNLLRQELFNHLQTLPLSYFDAHTHGELMSRFTNDTDHVQMALQQAFVSLISSAILFLGITGVMIYMSPLLFLVTALMLCSIFAVFKILGGRSRRYYKDQQKTLGALNGNVQENIEGLRVVKAFCYEDQARAHFDEVNSAYQTAATEASFYASALMPISSNIINVGYALTACAGGLLAALTPTFDIGSLAVYLNFTRQVGQPINQISQQITNLLSALAGAERIFEVMDMEPEVDTGKVTLVSAERTPDGSLRECADRGTHLWAWKSPAPDGSYTLTELRGAVTLSNVDFSYVPEKPVLKQVSFYAKPGQKIALVGSTGAGKTTITNLINRFYEIDRGSITYDGIDIRDISKDSLRRSLGMVLQDTCLFSGTVMDNIRYGRLDATDEACIEAAKSAGAHSFIRRLPNGYQTVISSEGGNLSQGERQLLAIARAAVADPPVMVLDEATASIDTRTERLIERGMDALMENRTVFVIAHRLSTVRNANAILVIENGEIIERGDHNDLLRQKGRYYALYTGQHTLS